MDSLGVNNDPPWMLPMRALVGSQEARLGSRRFGQLSLPICHHPVGASQALGCPSGVFCKDGESSCSGRTVELGASRNKM